MLLVARGGVPPVGRPMVPTAAVDQSTSAGVLGVVKSADLQAVGVVHAAGGDSSSGVGLGLSVGDSGVEPPAPALLPSDEGLPVWAGLETSLVEGATSGKKRKQKKKAGLRVVDDAVQLSKGKGLCLGSVQEVEVDRSVQAVGTDL